MTDDASATALSSTLAVLRLNGPKVRKKLLRDEKGQPFLQIFVEDAAEACRALEALKADSEIEVKERGVPLPGAPILVRPWDSLRRLAEAGVQFPESDWLFPSTPLNSPAR